MPGRAGAPATARAAGVAAAAVLFGAGTAGRATAPGCAGAAATGRGVAAGAAATGRGVTAGAAGVGRAAGFAAITLSAAGGGTAAGGGSGAGSALGVGAAAGAGAGSVSATATFTSLGAGAGRVSKYTEVDAKISVVPRRPIAAVFHEAGTMSPRAAVGVAKTGLENPFAFSGPLNSPTGTGDDAESDGPESEGPDSKDGPDADEGAGLNSVGTLSLSLRTEIGFETGGGSFAGLGAAITPRKLVDGSSMSSASGSSRRSGETVLFAPVGDFGLLACAANCPMSGNGGGGVVPRGRVGDGPDFASSGISGRLAGRSRCGSGRLAVRSRCAVDTGCEPGCETGAETFSGALSREDARVVGICELGRIGLATRRSSATAANSGTCATGSQSANPIFHACASLPPAISARTRSCATERVCGPS